MFEILAGLGGAITDFGGGAIDVFGSFPDDVVDSRKLGLVHPVGPHDPGHTRVVCQPACDRPSQ